MDDEEISTLVAGGYDLAANRYAALERSGGEWPRVRWLRELLVAVPEGARILDLGCGSADPAGVEIARRHELVGVDVSTRQIELARRNVPEAMFLVADMAEVSFEAGSFGAVVSFYAIGHVRRALHETILGRIHEWLAPGGLLLLSEEDGDRAGGVGEWLGVPMYFSSHDAAALRELVAGAGFRILRTEVERQREGDVDVPFTWILAQRIDRPVRP